MKKTAAFILFLLAFACVKEDVIQIDMTKCNIDMENYDFNFGIDYETPQKYLIPGEQSKLNDEIFVEIRNEIGNVPRNLTGVLKVSNWISQNFNKVNGNDIGNKTLNQLYALRTIYDSHSAALIISGTLRKYGFPTTMIEAASIQWAYDFRNGDRGMYEVHVMTEVYVEDRWVLLDNNGTFVYDYDPGDPFISALNTTIYPLGLFVYAKGKDTWDYQVRREQDTYKRITNFAYNILCFEDKFYTNDYTWKN